MKIFFADTWRQNVLLLLYHFRCILPEDIVYIVIYSTSDTTILIWEALKNSYMSIKTEGKWRTIAGRFSLLRNLPNCWGALDGKHIRFEKIPGTGSSNFNYKSYDPIGLWACSDADGIFTTIETGYAGRNSDGGIFRESVMKNWITNESLTSHLLQFYRMMSTNKNCPTTLLETKLSRWPDI